MKSSIVSAYRTGAMVAQALALVVLRGLRLKMAFRAVALIASSMIAASGLTLSAFSQTPIDSGWSLLRNLPQQTRIHVAGTNINKTCNFVSADEEKLVCSSGRTTSATLMTFSRPDVRSVKLTFLAESALTGASIREGSSPLYRAVTKGRNADGVNQLSDVVLGVAVLADRLMTGGIGNSVEVFRESTVYQRPRPQV